EALEGTPLKTFSIPEGIVFTKIDPETGKPPTAQSQKIILSVSKKNFLQIKRKLLKIADAI
ncbi:MAG: hypothetical protein JRI87_01565, partial [Deltaproteobacteria bacterium]|nr:hypothetical protein [Deltaproteobacteria bacterium]